MATKRLDEEIDALYRLPLADFTAARKALAKTGGKEVRSLEKPTVPAWAVNQLYWRDRAAYDALVEAADEQRRAHKAVLAGRAGDLRDAGKAHDEAVERALKSTLGILAESGHPATDPTRQGILNTLRALPAGDAPGRLTRTLQPGGFEMLAGLTIAGRAAAARPSARAPEPGAPAGRKAAGAPAATKRADAERQARIESATRRLKEAEQAARREEFEAARAAREAEKAERRVADARAAFEAAQEALQDAEADVPKAQRAREASGRRAAQAADAAARARAALDKLRG